jgi:predicted nucleotidyltransferase
VDLSAVPTILIEQFPGLQALYLFGSRATDQALPGSDLDLALLLPPGPSDGEERALELLRVRALCEEAAGGRVDLVDLRAASTILQIEVLRAERRLLVRDALAAAEFEMLTLSYYQRLNEQRRGILGRFRETGRAYAR